MIRLSTHKKKYAVSFIIAAAFFMISFKSHAQNVLVGLASNGSVDGKGTAFSISTNGANFSVMQGFVDWGNTPNGSLFKDDDGNFYGMTRSGGTYNAGTIFKMSPDGKVTMLKQFNFSIDGAYPDGELIKGNDGYLYGLTSSGGPNGYGTIFKISTSGDFSVIKSFVIATEGGNPHGHLTLAKDGNFYGITFAGGSAGAGVIFKLTSGGIYSVIHTMNKSTEGGTSYASLTEGTDGNLYGTTYSGGTNNFGTIFKVTKGGALTVLRHLNSTPDGAYPQSDLIQANDGNFYGTCYGGGQFSAGTIFKIASGGSYTVVKHLNVSVDGGNPYAGLMQNSDGSFYGITRTGGPKNGGTIYKLTAGVFKVIHALDYNTEGSLSSSVLARGDDGNLYGMTSYGGTFTYGIIFKTTTAGAFTVIGNFNGATLGNLPYSSFIKGKDSAYYCTTSAGGAYNYGTIVKICGGKASVLFSFNKAANGGVPKGDLLLASDGNFYGMTSEGGTNNVGTVFKITPGGAYTVLHHFKSASDGANPNGSLIQAKDGLLYGTTTAGGPNNAGTIFKMNLSGTSFTVIKSFVFATDGASPNGKLLQANDNNFYGMTSNGGRIFRLTTAGVYTNMHTFNSSLDGYNALGSLIQGSDGNLYGTCSDGGSKSAGTIFQMSLSGGFKVLRILDATLDGRMPKGSLLEGPDGMLYGITSLGGTYNSGTIFKISKSGSYTVLHHMNIAKDGGNAYGSLIFAPVNHLIANPQSVNVNEDSTVKITLTGSGGSPLTYVVTTGAAHGKVTGTGNLLTYKPNKNFNGKDQFSFAVSVGCIASAPAIVTITVKPRPDSPVLAPIGNKTVKVNTLLTFTATATDPDKGQALTYSLVTPPAGATINTTTGVFKWTPTTAGTYSFKIRVKDNDTPSLYDEEKITVTVTSSFAASVSESNMQWNAVTKINMFPNPVDDVLHIQLSSPSEHLSVKVFDMKGVMVAGYNFNNTAKNNCNINVSKFSQGMYIVQLQAEGINESLKFIKK